MNSPRGARAIRGDAGKTVGVAETLFADFASACEAWRALEKEADFYPFQTYAWLETWFGTIGAAHGWSPAILLLERADGKGRALLPLGIARKTGLRRLSWLGEGVSDYCGALVAPAGSFSAADLLAAIRRLAARKGCHIIDLDRNPADFPSGANPLVGKGFRLLHYKAHSTAVPDDMEGFLADRFTSKERYNLRRAAKRLEEAGRLRFAEAGDEAGRADLTDRMIALKRERYRAIGAIDNFADPSFAEFYRAAARRSDLGVHISALYLDETAIALHWGLRADPIMYYLMPAFAAGAYERYSPGAVFLREFVEQCGREGLERLDFTIGDEEYKDKWRDRSMDLFRFREGRGARGEAFVAFASFADRLRSSGLRDPLVRIRAAWRRRKALRAPR
ncbi:GNAT family N-acetyltransferase [bacterium]|nr:GNAT family N-acetyltransferase [bacterium]